MFASRRTLIAPGLKIIGSVEAEGLVKVKGEIQGDLRCTSVVISRKAHVVGPIEATRVVVDGKVEGPIHGEEVVLKSKANVVGDIKCRSLVIDKGAFVDGRLAFALDKLEHVKDGKANGQTEIKTLTNEATASLSRQREKVALAKAEASTRITELVVEARHLSKNPNLPTEEALVLLSKRGNVEARTFLNALRKGQAPVQDAANELDANHASPTARPAGPKATVC